MIARRRRWPRERFELLVATKVGRLKLLWDAGQTRLTAETRLQAVPYEPQGEQFLRRQLGEADGDFLAEHQSLIPRELWEQRAVIVLPGTVWEDRRRRWVARALWRPVGQWIRSRLLIAPEPGSQLLLFDNAGLEPTMGLWLLVPQA